MKATLLSSSISANLGNSGEAMVEIHKYSVGHYKKYSHFTYYQQQGGELYR